MPFWSAFGIVFLTEIADKSRVAGLLLATTFQAPWRVFFGMTLGYACLEAISVFLGGLLPRWIPMHWLEPAVGGLFILLGIAALFFSESVEDHASRLMDKIRHWGPFVASFAVTAFSEIGDRTQISAAALSAQSNQPWFVFGGAMSALILLNAITVWIGNEISQKLSLRRVHQFAGAIFILFGIIILIQRVL